MSKIMPTIGVLGACVLSAVAGAVFRAEMCRPVNVAAPSAAVVTVQPCRTAGATGCVADAVRRDNAIPLTGGTLPSAWDGWQRISVETAAVLRTGGDADDRETRDWTACFEHNGDTATITCPDGHVETS